MVIICKMSYKYTKFYFYMQATPGSKILILWSRIIYIKKIGMDTFNWDK